jgi:hypothetical protein
MLTLRPTRLSRDPNAKDWSIHEDGQEIGRLYRDEAASRPEVQWFWSAPAVKARLRRSGVISDADEAPSPRGDLEESC